MQSDRAYSHELQLAISAYIKQREHLKSDSKLVASAKKFLNFVSYELLEEEKLHDVQLMWRMLDYVTRKNGSRPFGDCKNLRDIVMTHLCMMTGVTAAKLKLEEQKILVQEIAENNKRLLPFFTATFVSDDERRNKAIKNIITHELTLRSEQQLQRYNFKEGYYKLSRVVNDYCHTYQDSCFRKEGVERAVRFSIELKRLCDVECLDEHQLLCRLMEHVALPIESDMGYFETSQDLRMNIIRALCELACVDDDTLSKSKNALREGVIISRLSNFGPVYREQNPYLLEWSARVSCLARALYNRPRSFMMNALPLRALEDSDKNRELTRFSLSI